MPTTTKLDNRRAKVKAKGAELGSSRERLLDAAVRVFARDGYSGTSIDRIAAEAGLSKGAVYWNFASKEELFFALLDERVDRRIRALFDQTEEPPPGQASEGQVSAGLSAVLEQERELVVLFHEYSAMAVRDPRLRERYVERNVMLRDGLARAFEARVEAFGAAGGVEALGERPSAVDAQELATAVIALADGLSIERLTEPEVVSEELFGEILSLILDGLAARAKGCI
ncbi:MAG TPA: TetR/AcrR family transcriptional regulator [Solirubrobacteraceae bacterium]|jgi:AcrR family transcriptional regulator